MTQNESIEYILRHPVSWVVGGVTSIVGVAFTFGVDPVTAIAALAGVFSAQATSIFTGATIIGFTLSGFIPWDGLVKVIQIIAVISGLTVVVKILDAFWDKFKRRIDK